MRKVENIKVKDPRLQEDCQNQGDYERKHDESYGGAKGRDLTCCEIRALDVGGGKDDEAARRSVYGIKAKVYSAFAKKKYHTQVRASTQKMWQEVDNTKVSRLSRYTDRSVSAVLATEVTVAGPWMSVNVARTPEPLSPSNFAAANVKERRSYSSEKARYGTLDCRKTARGRGDSEAEAVWTAIAHGRRCLLTRRLYSDVKRQSYMRYAYAGGSPAVLRGRDVPMRIARMRRCIHMIGDTAWGVTIGDQGEYCRQSS